MPDRTLSEFIVDAAVKPLKALTAAEERVADLVARGWSYKAIAGRLNAKPSTIYHHVEAIAAKLPDDDLAPKERVLIWALCRAAKTLSHPHAA